MDGFDFLGAITIGEAKRDSAVSKAKSAGERAVSAGRRIAKRAPRLSAAVVAAGQKALNAGRMGPASKKKTAAGTPGKAAVNPKGSTAVGPSGKSIVPVALPRGTVLVPVGPQMVQPPPRMFIPPRMQPRPAPGPQMAPPTKGPAGPLALPRGGGQAAPRGPQSPPGPTRGPQMAPGTRGGLAGPKVRVGEDPPADDAAEEVVDLRDLDEASALAAAAEQVAAIALGVQELMDQIPEDQILFAKGKNILETLAFIFGDPLERAASGTASPAQDTAGIIANLANVMEQREAVPPAGMWAWAVRAQTFIEENGAGDGDKPASDPMADPNAPTDTAPGVVAKVVVDPISITVAQGQTQPFRVVATDSAGNPVTPKGTVRWSASGGVIDQSGGFGSNTPGTFTITAVVDGVTGTGTAEVQGSTDTAASTPSGGGYDGSGITSTGPTDPGTAATEDPGADPYADQGYDPYAEGEYGYEYDPYGYAAEGAMTNFYGLDEGFDGGGSYEDDPSLYEGEPVAEGYQEGLFDGSQGDDSDLEDPMADDGAYLEGEEWEEDAGFVDLIGKGGKGGGGRGRGGHGHGGHRHRGRRGGRGWGWGGGPYYYGAPEVYLIDDGPDEIADFDDNALLDSVAEEIAARVREKTAGTAVGHGLDDLGAEGL